MIEGLVVFLIHLVVIGIVFSLLYWIAPMVAGLFPGPPSPLRPKIQVLLIVIITLILILVLLGDVGAYGTWGYGYKHHWW